MILIPYGCRDGVVAQSLLDLHLDFHITLVVPLEELPFLRRMLRQIPGATAVCLGRPAWGAEVTDQVGTFFQLLVIKLEDLSDICQGEWKPQVCTPDHGAAPA